MHPVLADDFLNVDVVETLKNIIILSFLPILTTLLGQIIILGDLLILEHVVGDSLVFGERAVDDILVVLGSVGEFDHFGCLLVEMVHLHGVVFDGDFGELEVADVDAGGFGVLLQEFNQTL